MEYTDKWFSEFITGFKQEPQDFLNKDFKIHLQKIECFLAGDSSLPGS